MEYKEFFAAFKKELDARLGGDGSTEVVIWSSFFVTLTQNKFHLLLYRFSNGVRYPFEECGRL